MTVLIIVAGIFIYRGVKGKLSDLIEEYTDTQPRSLPQLKATEAEARETVARVDGFLKAVAQGDAADPMVLTGDEINRLIHHHPRWKALAGKVHVTIEDDRILGKVSFPLAEFSGFLKGRYLNGSAVFSVGLESGRLLVFVDSVEVKGEPLPEAAMQQVRSENLAEKVNKDDDIYPAIRNLESVAVENGLLHIVPKKPE